MKAYNHTYQAWLKLATISLAPMLVTSIIFSFFHFTSLNNNSTIIRNGIIQHLFIVGFALIILSLVCHIILRVFKTTSHRSLAIVLSALFFFIHLFILTAEASTFIGIYNWGTGISAKLLSSTFSDFLPIYRTLNTQLAMTSYTIAAVLAVMCLVLYYWYFRSEIDAFIRSDKSFRIMFSVTLLPLGILLFYEISSLLLSPKILERQNSFLKNHEPFYSFLFQNYEASAIDADVLSEIQALKSSSHIKPSKNVVLITIDCLRSDHLDFNGYSRKTSPFLSSLFESNALHSIYPSFSMCSSSYCGILSILNSLDPDALHNYKYGIHDHLKNYGYKTNFILSGVHSNFQNLKKSYGPNIDYFFESLNLEDYNFNDDYAVIEAYNNLDDFDEQANFFYTHLMSPHISAIKNDSFQLYKPTKTQDALLVDVLSRNTNTARSIELAINNYDNGILQVDHIIKEILSALDTKGYLENSLVIITADHGESFGEHKTNLGHGSGLWNNYIGIPLLIIDSDTSQLIHAQSAVQTDIAPSISDNLKIPIPDFWLGKSIYQKDSSRFSFHKQLTRNSNDASYAIIKHDSSSIKKFIYDSNTGNAMAYELLADPNELSNLIDSSSWADTLGSMLNHKFSLDKEQQQYSYYNSNPSADPIPYAAELVSFFEKNQQQDSIIKTTQDLDDRKMILFEWLNKNAKSEGVKFEVIFTGATKLRYQWYRFFGRKLFGERINFKPQQLQSKSYLISSDSSQIIYLNDYDDLCILSPMGELNNSELMRLFKNLNID